MVVTEACRIADAILLIDKFHFEIVLVLDKFGKLIGTVTDGDVRRGILKNISNHEPVMKIMNKKPFVATTGQTPDEIFRKMKPRIFRYIPVVDQAGNLTDLMVVNPSHKPLPKPNWVVLMAGGEGSRLQPLTQDCPKPLLRLEDKPLLETILLHLAQHGFCQFYIAVNYKADMIKQHFGNGEAWGVQIYYLHEERKLGTAGALSLLPRKPEHPFLVMNADLLTKINVNHLMDFHAENRSDATMCVREYDFQVPYGVAQIESHRILCVDEKPVQRFFVNAGIYVFEPHVINQIPRNAFLDMPTLLNDLIRKKKQRVTAFPIREYWLDVGSHNDFSRAVGEYPVVFETAKRK